MSGRTSKSQWMPGLFVMAALLVFSLSSGAAPDSFVQTNAPPSLPMLKSPVDSFRELLVMPLLEQQKFLMIRPPEIQQRIQEKIREYQSLSPAERELRLQATELRWYLLVAFNQPATNHAAYLALMPPAMRELVEPRLQWWTILPPPLKQLILTNEQAAAGCLIRVENSAPQPFLAEDQRRKLSESFNRLLELTPREKEKTLRTLSKPEREQMEKTLEAFGNLPRERRIRCVQSFTKFAALSGAEQQEFLKNADRWSQMPPEERQRWRELVSVAPILPPLPFPPLPELPFGVSATVATNRR